MVSNNLVTLSALLGFSGLVLILVAVILPQWRVNSPVASEPNMRMLIVREGLWIRCTGSPSYYWNCDNYDTALIGLPAYLSAFRALMIIAFIASLVGFVCSVLGMRCARVIDEESNAKRWMIIIGGICHIAAGVLTCVCVSWYAAEVVREYYSPYYQTQKLRYTLGACLYVGWVASVFSLIAGGLMACCSCFAKPVDQTGQYKPAKQQFSYPTSAPAPIPVASYNQSPYKPDYKSAPPPRRSGRYSSRHTSRHSSHHSSHRARDSSFDSSSTRSHEERKSSRNGSRHDSDIMRASGFV